PDHRIGTQAKAGRPRRTAGRQMHTGCARSNRCLDVAMHRDGRVAGPAERYKAAKKDDPSFMREVFFPQTDPAAAAAQCSRYDVFERPARLAAIGDEKERWLRELHDPTSPSCGLDGSAYVRLAMRPARRAFQPASTAARIAVAIRTGSRDLAM